MACHPGTQHFYYLGKIVKQAQMQKLGRNERYVNVFCLVSQFKKMKLYEINILICCVELKQIDCPGKSWQEEEVFYLPSP